MFAHKRSPTQLTQTDGRHIMSSPIKDKSTLLGLPQEIRREIYFAVFNSYTGPVTIETWAFWRKREKIARRSGRLDWLKPKWFGNGWLETLLICHTVFDEAEPVLYKTITIAASRFREDNQDFCSLISQRARSSVVNVKLNVESGHPSHQGWGEGTSYIARKFTNLRTLMISFEGPMVEHISCDNFFDATCRIQDLEELEIFVPLPFNDLLTKAKNNVKPELIKIFNHLCPRIVKQASVYRTVHSLTIDGESGWFMSTKKKWQEDK